ncbi:vesicle coat protein [Pseudomassariella vexata]|uniref:Vesicle coat protein n=1 Tax=Pseudomassariella vexata TaxID=1141098 RepID=A0A1Y2E704_9PEZI|nr:vesicle coat protein [Pseudomassariella vexata]ORY67217.1 vesicle coat protein [Pseudomassariella vexata]
MVVTHRRTPMTSSNPLLTSKTQLCLAHYCDLHGPTPLMVTEGLPVPCSRCYDDTIEQDRPQSSATAMQPPSVADALRKMTLHSSRSSSLPATEQEAQAHRSAIRRASRMAAAQPATAASPTTASAIETPPQSPGNPTETSNDKPNGPRRDSSFRRTYDDYVTKRANPCQNCALTLPKRQDSKDKKAAADAKGEQRGPTLRTRAPYARVYGGSSGDMSPPNSNPQSSCASDTEDDVSPTNTTTRPSSHRRPTTSTSQSSISSKSSVNTHTHYLDYTSTHEPQIANTYSTVRASCLRTLSCETLPRRPEHGVVPSLLPSSASPSIPTNPAYISAPATPQSAAAGGPIFFGDPLTGYTTAYIFRIPDMHARGRKRVYAFLALSTHRERLAMKAFGFVAAAFRDLATWIQDLAEAEAEREREREAEGSPFGALGGGYSEVGPRDSGVGLGLGGGSFERERERDRDSGSSFLTSGGSRAGFINRMGMGGSMGPGGFAPKARGLAELVGLPDFFIELHARFVTLLLELGVVLGS